jgi:hypothetical protein
MIYDCHILTHYFIRKFALKGRKICIFKRFHAVDACLPLKFALAPCRPCQILCIWNPHGFRLYQFHKILLQLVGMIFMSQFQNIRKKNVRSCSD